MQLRGPGRGYSPVCPEGSTLCCALVAVVPVGEGSSVLNLLCAKDQAMKAVGTGRYLADFPAGYEGDSLACFSHFFFLLSFSSCLHLSHCLQSIGEVIIFPFLSVVFETIYVRLGLKPAWQRLCAVLSHSVVFD